MDRHICGSCKRKDCPEAGNEKYDGMLGPTIGCARYKPCLWSLLDGFVDCVILFVVLAAVVWIIHAIVINSQGL